MFKLYKTKKLMILILATSVVLSGCSFNIKDKFKDTFSKNEYGLKATKYVIDTTTLNNKKIEISLPKGFVAIGDTDETKNAYVSLYNTKENSIATKEDYVLTYKINSTLDEDLETTLHTYNNMYENLLVSEIQPIMLSNNVNCKFYTISYFLSNENLTDYIFEFEFDGTKIISKMGTTFYPIEKDIDEIGVLLFENINTK